MLMVVPTRLLFLCLFSQRKSRALRAWACDKGRVLYRLTRKNLSAAALHSLKDYRNWLCAYSAVYCCQELKQCGAQRKPKKNTCNQNNADLKKKKKTTKQSKYFLMWLVLLYFHERLFKKGKWHVRRINKGIFSWMTTWRCAYWNS